MAIDLWKLPVPVPAILRGPFFKVIPKRQCEISFTIEGEDGGERWLILALESVEAFKVTYLTSLGSVDRELRTQAYGSLISIEDSGWLTDVRKNYLEYCAVARLAPKTLEHLMITFDDGPCYEFICAGFQLPAAGA
jgi:hypothetical protein